MVVDEISHFKGRTATGNKFAPETGLLVNDENLKISSAKITTAYDDVEIDRTMALVKDAAFERPIIVDLIEAHSENSHQYDLPFHYNGQLTETNFEVQAYKTSRAPLGAENGYQYLWDVARAKPVNGLAQVTWLLDRRFYSVSTAVPVSSEIIFAEVGANDPNFNLRREPAFILRSRSDDGISLASVIEPHGEYNPTVEFTLGSHPSVKSVRHYESGGDEFIRIETKDGDVVGLGISGDMSPSTTHSVDVGGIEMNWIGPYKLFHSEKHKKDGT